MLGTNDATNWENEKNDYVQDYTDLVNLYRTTFGEQLNIIMITSPRCMSPNNFGIPSDTICNEVVPLQRQLAEDLNCYLLDLNAEFDKHSDAELFIEKGLDELWVGVKGQSNWEIARTPRNVFRDSLGYDCVR